MEQVVITADLMSEQKEQAVGQAFTKESDRLLRFIRNRVPEADAEDILMDVFYQFTANFNVLQPIEQVGAWLFRAARNRIIDRYRKKRPDSLDEPLFSSDEDGDGLTLADTLTLPAESPEDQYARSLVWEALEEALAELPKEQREVFVMHELEDRSFKEIAEITGAPVNTLLSRKRYAVLFLRGRLQGVYNDLLKS